MKTVLSKFRVSGPVTFDHPHGHGRVSINVNEIVEGVSADDAAKTFTEEMQTLRAMGMFGPYIVKVGPFKASPLVDELAPILG